MPTGRSDRPIDQLRRYKNRYDTEPGHANRAALIYVLQRAVAADDTPESRRQAGEISGFPPAGVAALINSYYQDTALHDRRGIPLLDL